ncbi:MAG: InlB B-repeat-containing protein, partial [Clostridia bacterium]
MKERVKRRIALLLTVVMTVSVMPTTLAAGNAAITTQTEETAAVAPGNFANEQSDVAPVTPTAGQTTVSAPVTNDYTVTFHDGTSSVVSKTVAKGTVIARADLPAEPTKNGHIFLGWYEAGVTGATDRVVTGSSFTGKEF